MPKKADTTSAAQRHPETPPSPASVRASTPAGWLPPRPTRRPTGRLWRAKVAARPVDVPYQIELLGNPDQRADISNCLRPYRSRGTQIRDRRLCCRAQHNLARNGTATDWVPDRLGRDTVAEAIHISFEDMHIFHVACIRPKRKRHTIFYGTGATHDALLSFRNAKVGLA